MTNDPIGAFRLPLEITVPLALVNVIEPIEFGSGSHAGAAVAAEAVRGPIAVTPVNKSIAANGANATAMTVARRQSPTADPDGFQRAASGLAAGPIFT
jgi:hypothetical protein